MKDVNYAGFWKRVGADLIDSCLLDFSCLLLGLVILGGAFWLGFLPENPQVFLRDADSFLLQIILVGLRGSLALFYYTGTIYFWGATLGKRAFRIRVVSEIELLPLSAGQALIRCVGYLVSYGTFGLGFIWAAFHPKKKALHDVLARTVTLSY